MFLPPPGVGILGFWRRILEAQKAVRGFLPQVNLGFHCLVDSHLLLVHLLKELADHVVHSSLLRCCILKEKKVGSWAVTKLSLSLL